MRPQTHLSIDPRLCGAPVTLSPGQATVQFVATAQMAVDEHGLVHGGFVFGLADHAAMLAVNDPNVVLGAADTRFLAPVRVGDVVTALCPARLTPEAQQSVIAGSGSEYVYALDAAGELLWTANLHAPVQHVSTRASTQSGVDEILAAADRRLHVLDATGKITSGYEAPSPIAHIAPVAGALIVVTDDGHVEKLAHRRP